LDALGNDIIDVVGTGSSGVSAKEFNVGLCLLIQRLKFSVALAMALVQSRKIIDDTLPKPFFWCGFSLRGEWRQARAWSAGVGVRS
jgi:hypothetical protein